MSFLPDPTMGIPPELRPKGMRSPKLPPMSAIPGMGSGGMPPGKVTAGSMGLNPNMGMPSS